MDFRCLIIGDKSVGKSTFVQRCLTNSFELQHIPTNSMIVHNVDAFTLDGEIAKLSVYEGGYPAHVECIIIMFDHETFDSIKGYFDWIEMVFGFVPIILCRNKSDLPISEELKDKINSFVHENSKQLNFEYFEISVKSKDNFEYLLNFIAQMACTIGRLKESTQ